MTLVQIIDVEPRLVAVVRNDVAFTQMREAQQYARRVLGEALESAAVAPGPSLTVWRPPKNGVIDYAPGVFVPRRFGAPSAVTFLDLPAGRAAHVLFHGPYAEMSSAWSRLFEACETLADGPAGLNWEVYGGGEAASDTAEMDLYALLK